MANWVGVITNAGKALLNEWVAEKQLAFDRAAGGTGTVAELSMLAQTALVNEKQEAGFINAEKVEDGVRLKLRLTNATEGYDLQQVGIWGHVTGGQPVMLALYQHQDGIPIPAGAVAPDFRYTFYAIISCSNTGEWTMTVDTGTAATVGDMNEAISASAENVLLAAAEDARLKAENAEQNAKDAIPPIVNDLTTGGDGSTLSAEQGKVLAQIASAPPFDDAVAHAYGSYAAKDGKLYRATADIPAGTAWAPAQWQETTVVQELGRAPSLTDDNDSTAHFKIGVENGLIYIQEED